MKKVTLKDIAKELNVTVGTVSHVMNGIDDISEETRIKVFETAKRLGYISNSSAVSLRSGKTNTIAIIVPDISNPHIAYQIKLIEDKIKLSHYSVIILNTNEDDEAEYNAIVTACSKQVDGILLCPSQHSTKNVEFLNKLEIPYILIGRYFEGFNTDFVCADDRKGGYLAGKYLTHRGYKNPLYIGAFENIESSVNRFEGVKKAFSDVNINITKERFIQISPKTDSAENIMEKLKNDNISFDSIVAFSDLIAFKIITHIKKLYKGINIPVIGFDAVNLHLHMPFSYASVGMPDHGWADKAAVALLKKINGSNKVCKELIDVKLFEFNP